ncbi:MAG: aspartate aminotransferase family protein [Salinivirgaceae bacterium]|jgi:acetylornithine/N-succinyldiaminopimelate aminotransferase|nr:aspartate aminotransferase family protein [Salinivirgaceae bacterium]
MVSQRTLFLQHVGQTSPCPMALEIDHAKGIYLYDKRGKEYVDLVSGVSVSNVGHCNPKVIEAVNNQTQKYMHLMVYGEYVQEPQVNFAKAIIDVLPGSFQSVYFVNSGSEAIEGAMKLAKRFTGRREILAFNKAYHGSTHGALSIYGGEELKKAVQPLLPEVDFMDFNHTESLERITDKTACVVMEVIQAEAGILVAENSFLKAVRQKCDDTGTLLIFDEIQTGFGRTGEMFAFEHYGITPDILCLAKGMGGGMPIGSFISSKQIMDTLTSNPALGHITTFGGHPVSCAAGLASLKLIVDDNLHKQANAKGAKFRELLNHRLIDHIRGKGLFLAVEMKPEVNADRFFEICLEKGIIYDFFLFTQSAFRIAPPLTITIAEIEKISNMLLKAMDEISEEL